MKYPVEVMKILRMRMASDENDTTWDSDLEAYSPEKACTELVAWKLGDPAWYSFFEECVKSCGGVIQWNKDQPNDG